MLSIQPLTRSKSALVLKVWKYFEILFSYQRPVAYCRLNDPERVVVFRLEKEKSRTTEGHIETFANGRDVQSSGHVSFHFLMATRLIESLQRALFRLYEDGLPTDERTD